MGGSWRIDEFDFELVHRSIKVTITVDHRDRTLSSLLVIAADSSLFFKWTHGEAYKFLFVRLMKAKMRPCGDSCAERTG